MWKIKESQFQRNWVSFLHDNLPLWGPWGYTNVALAVVLLANENIKKDAGIIDLSPAQVANMEAHSQELQALDERLTSEIRPISKDYWVHELLQDHWSHLWQGQTLPKAENASNEVKTVENHKNDRASCCS